MTLPSTVADVLSEHVVFEVECIDRMYLNVYVPQLQHAGGLLGYVQRQLGLQIASTAPLARITDRFRDCLMGVQLGFMGVQLGGKVIWAGLRGCGCGAGTGVQQREAVTVLP